MQSRSQCGREWQCSSQQQARNSNKQLGGECEVLAALRRLTSNGKLCALRFKC
jgi:hypothetical protein